MHFFLPPALRFKKLQRSLGYKLLIIVFSIYFIITFIVTVSHMVMEYVNAKDEVFSSLKDLGNVFDASFSVALWNEDDEQAQSLMEGILKIPAVKGVEIQRPSGDLIMEDGIQTDFFYQQIVMNEEAEGSVGTVIMYSSTAFVFQKIQIQYLIIIGNAVFKTLALWVIFLLVIRYVVSRPLSALSVAIGKVDLENLNSATVDIGIRDENELKVLETSFNQMITNLIQSRHELKEKERLEVELKTAHTVQELLIPSTDPVLQEIEISSYYQSADETGGDWYQYQYNPENQALEVAIGDVTGHGISAALVAAMINGAFGSLQEQRLREQKRGSDMAHMFQPSYFLNLLNDLLYQTVHGEYTMTLFYSVIDLQNKTMTYTSAAHNSIYVWRPTQFEFVRKGKSRNRSILDLNVPGTRVGYAPNNQYQTDTLELQKDDVILWLTDGLIENKNREGEMFGQRKLKQILKQCKDLDAKAIRNQIISGALNYYGNTPFGDDVTFIVGKIK